MYEICKLNQKHDRVLYTWEQMEFLSKMPKLEGHEWDGSLDYAKWKWGDGVKIVKIKKYIKKFLIARQGLYCAYCGMKLELTSDAQIEHIAPKGKGRFPNFMFHSWNLVLACSLCNGFEKKERAAHFKTIGKLGITYIESYFNIVHPYLDDPSDHYEFGRDGASITISHKTLKGQKSIEVFTLYDEPQTNARGEHLMRHQYTFDPIFAKAFEESCSRHGY